MSIANFVDATQINEVLNNIIDGAEDYLMIVSPFIKLHQRIKERLILKKEDYELEIKILFGKNEKNKRSISEEDVEFFKQFPNIEIYHNKNLHAKYYACENLSLITSMNLYQFSQNENIEIGVVMTPKGILNKVTENYDLGREAESYFFGEILKNSQLLFKKTANFSEASFLKSKKYIGSTIEIDELDNFFQEKYIAITPKNIERKHENKPTEPNIGYCIRTGIKIPFNPEKPFCNEAYQSWAQFKNPDYKEKYDHLTGEPSNGKTSMRKPILIG